MTNDVNYFEIESSEPREPWRPVRHLGDGRGDWAIFYVEVEDGHAATDRAQQLRRHRRSPFIDNGAIAWPRAPLCRAGCGAQASP